MLMHQLYIFIRVAEEKSFSKAAESIYLSQSTVSTHIASLEKYFGQKLFDRLGKKVVLNCFGEKLYPWAKEILLLKEKALMDLKDYKIRIEGNIKICASTVPAHYIVPQLISRFSSQNPDIKFTLETYNSKYAAEMLLRGETDLAFLGLRYYTDKLNYLPLTEEKLVLITPLGVEISNTPKLKDLIGYPFLFRKPGSATQMIVEKILKKSGIDVARLKVVSYFDSVQVLMQCVREGLGISIVSEIAASEFMSHNLIKTFELGELSEKREFYLAYNKEKTISPVGKLFMDFCTAQENIPKLILKKEARIIG
ncbi:MAG: LysR family transcriptional regulator [Peptococcaceae bacterium]|nr:LysR family transcriptional regulator [Peptococcaceae bacterium]